MNGMLRSQLPTLITFSGLACAFSATLLVVHEELAAASVCILVGGVLDGLDGWLARRLRVATAFGRQLDSLVDVVTFGLAPSLLVYQYLRQLAFSPVVMGLVCAVYLVSGVFRLARFNLLPTKTSRGDSLGLTISISGMIVALSVLSNRAHDERLIPAALFPVLLVVLALLMVSRIRYPRLPPILRSRWPGLAGLVVIAALATWLSPQLAGLALAGGYASLGPLRSAYHLLR